jgi:DNA repair protein RadC
MTCAPTAGLRPVCAHSRPVSYRRSHPLYAAAPARDPRGYGELRRRAEALGPIGNAAAFYWLIEPLVAGARHEMAHVTMLGIYGEWRATRQVGSGTIDAVDVPLPETLRAAIDSGCRYAILSHNHPSGWAWPSEADAELTRAVERACAEVDLVLLDHVVLGRGEFYSFREEQLWTIRS